MRFSQALYGAQPKDFAAIAQAAEEAGFHSVSLSDHVLVPAHLLSDYPYTPDGRPPFAPTTPWPDVWVTIGALSAVTRQLHFMTNVYVLPARNPLIAAKAVGTAASISGGRVILGVGAGWMREELELVGQPFERRGKRMEEQIEVLRALWRGGTVEFHGEFYDLPPLTMEPAPPEPIPIYIGGHSDIALDRAARLGDGWIGVYYPVEELEEIAGRLGELREKHGTSERPFEIVASPLTHPTPDVVERLDKAGVTTILTSAWMVSGQDPADVAAAVEAVRSYGEQWIAPLQGSGLA